jgi:hypothetical protein
MWCVLVSTDLNSARLVQTSLLVDTLNWKVFISSTMKGKMSSPIVWYGGRMEAALSYCLNIALTVAYMLSRFLSGTLSLEFLPRGNQPCLWNWG